MDAQGRLFKTCRRILGLRFLHFSRRYEETPEGPVVYICRHRNALGPISSLCLLPLHIRPWAFSVFMDSEACVAHLRDYTFPVAWKLGPGLSRLLAAWLGRLFTALVRSTGAIPVYRNSLKVRETYKLSIEALAAGDSLLIFPDISYASKEGETGALYEGFLLLEELWNRKTGQHIRFVPVNVSMSKRTITLGKHISFSGSASYREEKDRIVQALESAIDGMAEKYGA